MGLIGHFIDRACERRPDVMRRVLARPFGDLNYYVTLDDDREPCGCLVGSTALEGGLPASVVVSPDEDGFGTATQHAIAVAARVADADEDTADDVGMRVWCTQRRWMRRGVPQELAHARAVALLKARIARRLAEQDARQHATAGAA